jgi:phage terminase small subunit
MTKKTRAKQSRVKRRELAALEPIAEGPAMAALNPRQKLFVRALFEAPRKFGAAAFAARAAGYGTPTSTPQVISALSSRLCASPPIQEAIQEESRKYVTTLGPMAVRALKHLLGTPAHRDHGRALGLTMERIAPAQSTHTVNVTHHVVDHTAEAVAQLRMLKNLDVPRSRLEEVFGFSGLARYEEMLEIEEAKKSPRLIEGTAVEIRKQAS